MIVTFDKASLAAARYRAALELIQAQDQAREMVAFGIPRLAETTLLRLKAAGGIYDHLTRMERLA